MCSSQVRPLEQWQMEKETYIGVTRRTELAGIHGLLILA